MSHPLVIPKQQFFNANGDPLVGGKVYTYVAGTSTLQATYQDRAEAIPNTNPVILDANGMASIRLGSGAYKIVLKDADDNTIWTEDNVSHLNDGAVTLTKLPDGMFTADSSGRAKFADGFITPAKLATALKNTISNMVGDIKMHHTFNGAAPVPRGWLVCNGSQITEAVYDAAHGSGAYWEDEVNVSAVVNKYTPNLVGKYAVGVSSTSQDGSVAITSVGNASHQIDISHLHAQVATYWNEFKGGSQPTWFDTAGTLHAYSSSVSTTSSWTGLLVGDGSASSLSGVSGIYTGSGGTKATATDSQLSATQSIQPHSIEVLYIIKVV